MHLLAITPIVVSAEELERRQRRYDRLAPPGVSVDLVNLRSGPTALEDAQDMRTSEEALLGQFAAADPTGFDGFLPDCVLDPCQGVELARPVYGIGRLAAFAVAGRGATFSAVARNPAIAAELDRRLATYGLSMARPTAVMDLSVADIADDKVWARAVARTVTTLDCDYVINACSAVDITDDVQQPVLVDPTRTALAQLGEQLGGRL